MAHLKQAVEMETVDCSEALATWTLTGKDLIMKTVLAFKLFSVLLLLLTTTNGDESQEATTAYSTQVSSEDIPRSEEITSSNLLKPFQQPNNLERSLILDQLLKNYPNNKIIPDTPGSVMKVQADIAIREILDISEVDMDMKLNLNLEIIWNDPQLVYKDFGFNFVTWVSESIKEKIWIPTVSIMNEKDSPQHSSGFITENILWSSSGTLVLSTNVVTTVSCSMSLEDFPMDEQNCSIFIGSPNYDNNEMMLTVHPFMDPTFSSLVKNFDLLGVRVSPIIQHLSYSNRTSFAYELLLRRFVGYYIIGTFFPSALIVIISWLTFWMPRNSAGERMALGVTCVLTITTLLISSQASSPKVSYIKAIDIYMGVCFTLVFTTLIQSTSVGYLLRKVKTWETRRKVEGPENTSRSTHRRPPSFASVVRRVISGGLQENETLKVAKFLCRCDAWCRAMYPIVFLAFNVAYWTYYLPGSKFDREKGWTIPETYGNVTDGRL